MLPLLPLLLLLTTPIPLPILFVESWVTVRVFVLRKMAFLTKKTECLVVIKRFVDTAIELVILLMFATRNMGTPRYKSQYGKSSQSNNISTTIQEQNFGNQDQNKQDNRGDFCITQHQYQILLDLLKNVNNSNNQVQLNQVGYLSTDHQDQNSGVTGNIQNLKKIQF